MTRGTVLILLLVSSFVRADGGALRLSQRGAGVQVSVFTAPTPLRTGTIDVSVLVQEARTGKVILGLPARVRAWPVEAPHEEVEVLATTELATNKLLQAAHVELGRPGPWALAVSVETGNGPVEAAGEIDLEQGWPSWLALVGWVGWPFPVVVGFVLWQLQQRRRLVDRAGAPLVP
jgi:hypothetical protein